MITALRLSLDVFLLKLFFSQRWDWLAKLQKIRMHYPERIDTGRRKNWFPCLILLDSCKYSFRYLFLQKSFFSANFLKSQVTINYSCHCVTHRLDFIFDSNIGASQAIVGKTQASFAMVAIIKSHNIELYLADIWIFKWSPILSQFFKIKPSLVVMSKWDDQRRSHRK